MFGFFAIQDRTLFFETTDADGQTVVWLNSIVYF